MDGQVDAFPELVLLSRKRPGLGAWSGGEGSRNRACCRDRRLGQEEPGLCHWEMKRGVASRSRCFAVVVRPTLEALPPNSGTTSGCAQGGGWGKAPGSQAGGGADMRA